ncbi:MAG: glutaredoxin domain-containing protein [Candidatus Poribacteria bacterium]|nr:glutaredoxin domain-containing protein [Candidatus Poribacteria bacterium]
MANEKVEVYWRMYCPFSMRGLFHLKRNNVNYESRCITGQYELRDEIEARCGRRDVPQMFVDGVHIGDDDAIAEWAKSGKLKNLGQSSGEVGEPVTSN